MSAKYIFYSHNVNWARRFDPSQTFIDLGHGCGYKATMASDKKKIYFDYTISAGDMHIDIIRKFLKSPDGKVLPFGLPVCELLYSERSESHKLAEDMKREASANRLIVWMPTYRKSRLSRMHTDTTMGTTGLPILYEPEDIEEINEFCRANKVLIVLKKHILEEQSSTKEADYSNFKIVDDKFFRDRDADVYEFLGATDALITDYSSVGIDYMLLNRPLGYTLDDYDKYEAMRGWSMDNVKDYLPGRHMYNKDDFKTFIKEVSEGKDPYRKHREEVTNTIQNYKEGFSKRILDYFNI